MASIVFSGFSLKLPQKFTVNYCLCVISLFFVFVLIPEYKYVTCPTSDCWVYFCWQWVHLSHRCILPIPWLLDRFPPPEEGTPFLHGPDHMPSVMPSNGSLSTEKRDLNGLSLPQHLFESLESLTQGWY